MVLRYLWIAPVFEEEYVLMLSKWEKPYWLFENISKLLNHTFRGYKLQWLLLSVGR